MKKITVTITALAISATAGFSQGFYLNLGLGYAVSSAGQSMYDTPVPYNDFPTGYNGSRNNTATNEVYNIKSASFGAGLQGAIGVGYMFNDNIGVQLNAGLGLSSKHYTFSDNNVSLNVGGGSSVPYDINTTQYANTPLIMMPSLVLQTGAELKVYGRVGLALPLSTTVTQEQVLTTAPGAGALQVDDFSWQIKSGFSVGFTAAAGVKYAISDKISVWGELSFLSLSVYAKTQNLNSWTEDGQSVALTNYGSAQNIKFSKNAVVDSTLSNFPTYSLPFSNVGINVGVTFNLSKGNSRHSGRRNDEDIDPNKPFRRH